MEIVLIFTNSHHWLSRLICLLTGSRWSHVAIAVRGQTIDFLTGAELFEGGSVNHIIDSCIGFGVRPPRTINSLIQGMDDYLAIGVPVTHPGNAALWLMGQVGKPYDNRGLWGFFMPWRHWQDSNAWYCFELAARTLYYAGAENVRDLNYSGCITARRLLNYAKGVGHVVTV